MRYWTYGADGIILMDEKKNKKEDDDMKKTEWYLTTGRGYMRMCMCGYFMPSNKLPARG